MPERCPKCGSEMEWLPGPRDWICSLPPGACARIAELERQLEDAEARHRKSDWCREQNWQEVLSTRSELDAALAQVGVLEHRHSELVDSLAKSESNWDALMSEHKRFQEKALQRLNQTTDLLRASEVRERELRRELERLLEEAKLPCHRSHPHEDDPECQFNSEVHVSVLRSNAALRSERDAALAQVAELREVLDEVVEAAKAVGCLPDGYCFCTENRHSEVGGHVGECRDLRGALNSAAKLNTSATAQLFVEKIEREVLEKAADRAEKRLRDKGCNEDVSRLRAAILGEKGKG